MDITLKSELPDNRINHFFSKVNIHVHFVQFDVQASDGVITGFGYEQSVRPFTVEGENLVEGTSASDAAVRLTSVERFSPGSIVGVGMDQAETFEIKRIKEIKGNTLVFDEPLEYSHAIGEIVSTEFVRYRWQAGKNHRRRFSVQQTQKPGQIEETQSEKTAIMR